MTDFREFKEQPDEQLADELKQLGEKAKANYGEPVFGEFLIAQSNLYRTGRFQEEYLGFLDIIEEQERIFEEEKEKDLDNLMEMVDFDKQPIN